MKKVMFTSYIFKHSDSDSTSLL